MLPVILHGRSWHLDPWDQEQGRREAGTLCRAHSVTWYRNRVSAESTTISLFFQLIYVSATLPPFPDTPHLGPSVTPSLCPVASSPHPTSPKAILPGPRRVTAPHRRDAHHAPCARGLCASQALSITSLNPRNHSTKMNIVILVFQIRN